MNQDEIIRMAREAGGLVYCGPRSPWTVVDVMFTPETIERFAALVAAKEREVCLQIADYCADADMHASMAANAIRARGQQ